MPLVDLDDPEELRARWSALAAVAHATGFDRRWYADENGWHHQDETASVLRMVMLDGERSVLFGFHTMHSRTAGADLLAGAPDWIAQPEVRTRISAGELGFVYGSFNGTWARASYPGDPWQPLDDGFGPIATWLTSDEETADELVEWAAGWADYLGSLDDLRPIGIALIRTAATTGLTSEVLLDLFDRLGVGPGSLRRPDLRAGLVAAAEFGGPSAEQLAAVDAADPDADDDDDDPESFVVPPGISPFTGQPISDEPAFYPPADGPEPLEFAGERRSEVAYQPPGGLADERPDGFASGQQSSGAAHDRLDGFAEERSVDARSGGLGDGLPGGVAEGRLGGSVDARSDRLADERLDGPADGQQSSGIAQDPPGGSSSELPGGVFPEDPGGTGYERSAGVGDRQPEDEAPALRRTGLTSPETDALPMTGSSRVGAEVPEGEDYYASLFADGPAATRYAADRTADPEPARQDPQPPAEERPWTAEESTSEFFPFDDDTASSPVVVPELELPGDPAPRLESPPGSLEEAMRAERERPRPRPAESAALEALREWCRARTRIVPSGFTLQVQVLDPDAPSYRFDLEPPDVDDPQYAAELLGELLGELWLTEAESEQGGWLFARIDAAGRTVRIDRWYDQVPDWWDDPVEPRLDVRGLRQRMADREASWRPSYLDRLSVDAR